MPPPANVSSTPFSTAGMYWRGIAPADHLVAEREPLAAGERLEPQVADAELPVAAGLLLVLALGLGRPRDGLAIGDAQLLPLDVDVALAIEPFEGHGQVHLAAHAEDGLVRLVVSGDT